MKTQKYSVNQHLIETVLSWVKSGEIAIPEIQRPFVWDATRVRELMDSLYKGYPVGYLIAWKNPNVRLKDGSTSEGKKILIDGQQRVTALMAAILGQEVVTRDYKKTRIKIAFHPLLEKFEVHNTAIAKDSAWVPDIADVFSFEFKLHNFIKAYLLKNPESDEDLIYERMDNLRKIVSKQIGLIELDSDLDIEIVTEIFIRINSQGVKLSQADFAMSKIAANETYGGSALRKCIDYFCHLAAKPEFYAQIAEGDKEFAATPYFAKISWLKDEKDDLYDPDYNDLLRVAFTSEFNRGHLADLVSLLSGRNFETRTYEEEIVRDTFARLQNGVLHFVNETNFKNLIMIIRSAGFVTSDLIRSKNALNFAYILYLKLRQLGTPSADIHRHVRKWFVLSLLTGRYSGSPETMFDLDIRAVSSGDFAAYLQTVEEAELSDAFWNVALVQHLDTSSASSPYFAVFLAAQVRRGDKGFLSSDITVADLIAYKGNIHHLFPKDYLKKNGFAQKDYNQIANYVCMQEEINIRIGNKAPNVYFRELTEQCSGGPVKYGGITTMEALQKNLEMNCIPESIFQADFSQYQDFLQQRRVLMARKIRDYYRSL